MRRARERLSLRAIAAQVGVSAPTIATFVDGAGPRTAVRKKLSGWYAREVAADRQAVLDALRCLVSAVPSDHQDAAVRQMLKALVRVHRAHGARLPAWLRRLAATTNRGAPEQERP